MSPVRNIRHHLNPKLSTLMHHRPKFFFRLRVCRRPMIKTGILNPHVLDLVARIRHTNTLVIADWAFPFWPEIEVVDISLISGVPTVMQVLEALKPNFKIGKLWQAEEFLLNNPKEKIEEFDHSFAGIENLQVERLPHIAFKAMVPNAIGLIRTGDPTAYGNIIIESA